MKTILLLPGILLACFLSKAQTIPVELMAGNGNFKYQHHYGKALADSPFGFFNTSSLQVFYDQQKTEEIMSQAYLTYKLAPGVNLAAGAFYATGPGFKPSVSVQLYKATPAVLLLAVPRIDVWERPSADLMALLEFRPRLTEQVQLYTRLQVMENFTGTSHNRSYQHVRLGLDVKQLQFGVAANFDAYGPEMHYLPNYGLFIRKEIY